MHPFFLLCSSVLLFVFLSLFLWLKGATLTAFTCMTILTPPFRQPYIYLEDVCTCHLQHTLSVTIITLPLHSPRPVEVEVTVVGAVHDSLPYVRQPACRVDTDGRHAAYQRCRSSHRVVQVCHMLSNTDKRDRMKLSYDAADTSDWSKQKSVDVLSFIGLAP